MNVNIFLQIPAGHSGVMGKASWLPSREQVQLLLVPFLIEAGFLGLPAPRDCITEQYLKSYVLLDCDMAAH